MEKNKKKIKTIRVIDPEEDTLKNSKLTNIKGEAAPKRKKKHIEEEDSNSNSSSDEDVFASLEKEMEKKNKKKSNKQKPSKKEKIADNEEEFDEYLQGAYKNIGEKIEDSKEDNEENLEDYRLEDLGFDEETKKNLGLVSKSEVTGTLDEDFDMIDCTNSSIVTSSVPGSSSYY